MKKINITANSFLFGLFRPHYGHRVPGVSIYLETEPEKKLTAFQQTGESGGVTFGHLDKGIYKIYLSLPQMKEKPKVTEKPEEPDLQVGYHSKKKRYFFQESHGYFTVEYSDVGNLNDSNITPMYEWEQAEMNPRLLIAKIEVTGKYGQVTMKIASHSFKKFQKRINKYRQDAEMTVIKSKE